MFRRHTRTRLHKAVDVAHKVAEEYGQGALNSHHSKPLAYGRIVVQISPDDEEDVEAYLEEELNFYDYDISIRSQMVGIRYITADDWPNWDAVDAVEISCDSWNCEYIKGGDDEELCRMCSRYLPESGSKHPWWVEAMESPQTGSDSG